MNNSRSLIKFFRGSWRNFSEELTSKEKKISYYGSVGVAAIGVVGGTTGLLNYLISVQLIPINLQLNKLDALEKKFDEMDRRFRVMEGNTDKRFDSLDAKNDKRFDGLEEKIDKQFDETHKVLVEVLRSNERIAKLEK